MMLLRKSLGVQSCEASIEIILYAFGYTTRNTGIPKQPIEAHQATCYYFNLKNGYVRVDSWFQTSKVQT